MSKKIPDSGKVDSNASKMLVIRIFEKMLEILNKFANFGEIRRKISKYEQMSKKIPGGDD